MINHQPGALSCRQKLRADAGMLTLMCLLLFPSAQQGFGLARAHDEHSQPRPGSSHGILSDLHDDLQRNGPYLELISGIELFAEMACDTRSVPIVAKLHELEALQPKHVESVLWQSLQDWHHGLPGAAIHWELTACVVSVREIPMHDGMEKIERLSFQRGDALKRYKSGGLLRDCDLSYLDAGDCRPSVSFTFKMPDPRKDSNMPRERATGEVIPRKLSADFCFAVAGFVNGSPEVRTKRLRIHNSGPGQWGVDPP